MAIKTTHVSKCLDKKLLIMGYEVPDLLAIFLLLSILNLTLGQFGAKLISVWLPTISFALVLKYTKRGKPNNYLVHYLRHKLGPKHLCAFSESDKWKSPNKEKYD